MTTMGNACLRDYRSALALNNMGVSLLEKQAYRYSLETLLDALTVIGGVDRSERNDSASGSIEMKLRKATERLANANARKRGRLPGEIDIQMISYVEGLHTIHEALMVQAPSASKAFPIRMEFIDDSCCQEQKDDDCTTDVASAIILHNFGVGYMCLSSISKSCRYSNSLCTEAFKAFELAHRILYSLSSRLGNNDEQLLGLLLTTIAVVNGMVYVHVQLREYDECEKYRSKLQALREAVQESISFHGVTQAAPAA